MQNDKALFQTFSDARLIEIVKNARQFGYDDNIRSIAIEVLKERDISEEDLQLTGNLTNYKFDTAQDFYRSYNSSSTITFLTYLVLVFMKAITAFHLFGMDQPGTGYSIIYWIIFALYLITLIKSFLDHINFYKSVGKELGTGDQIIFFIIGMPLYFFMYFFYKSRMKEELQMVN